MSREKKERKLEEAARRLASATGDERMYSRDIDWHDSEASRIRKLRQAARNKMDRAQATITRLAAELHEEL